MKKDQIHNNITIVNGNPTTPSTATKTTAGIISIIDKLQNISLKQLVVIMILASLTLIGLVTYNISRQEDTVKEVLKQINKSEEAEAADLKIRDEITPIVQREMDKLLNQTNADRVCLFELHNGKANSTLLPFRYVDCTQESVNTDNMITYISDKYQNIPLSHYKIAYVLAEKKYLSLSYDEARQIDTRFAQEMEAVNGKYAISIMLCNNGTNIGFLMCFYDHNNNYKPNDDIRHKLTKSGQIISLLLDLNVQRTLRHKNVED